MYSSGFYLKKMKFKIKEAGVSFVPVCSGLTFSCSAQIVNGLIGQGHLLAAGVTDVPGCLKRVIHNSYVKAAFSSLSAFFFFSFQRFGESEM